MHDRCFLPPRTVFDSPDPSTRPQRDMNRRELLKAGCLAYGSCSIAGARPLGAREPLSVQRGPFFFLGMLYFKQEVTEHGASFRGALEDRLGVEADLPKTLAGGVGAALWSAGIETVATSAIVPVFEPPREKVYRAVFQPAAAVERVLRSLDGLHQFIAAAGPRVTLALSADDICKAYRSGQLALVLHFTGAWINGSLAVLRNYYRLGVRGLQVAITDNGDWIDSSVEPDGKGLSEFGRDVITEMNRLGMLVDVSHASDRATAAILETTTRPVIASHSNARALCNIRRNLTDRLVKKIADSGGVIGIHFASGFVREGYLKQAIASGYYTAARKYTFRLLEEFGQPGHPGRDPYVLARAVRNGVPRLLPPRPRDFELPPPATLEELINHVDYLVDRAGIEHVAIGGDWGGIGLGAVKGIENVSKLLHLNAALAARGYSAKQIEKIMGTNLLRAFRDAVG